MTRHHENERSSSSIYGQNNPWEPLVSFEGFIHDNETIEDQVTAQGHGAAAVAVWAPWPGSTVPRAPPTAAVPSAQDLVAWVTVGFLHVPHAEDIPNTATPGNAVGFFLRPFNFFDEDPSVASRSPVIVRPLDPPTFSQLQIQRWTPASPGPCVAPGPFTYNGTYWQE